jgi:uncharacterized membrane protein SpoIIM required for sporulation
MSAVSLPKRIREWGGRELATVSLCLAIGLVVGIIISLFTVTTKEDAENVINSSQQTLSRGILFSPADPALCSGRGPSDQMPPFDAPPSGAPLKQWRFLFEEWRFIFFKNLVVALMMATLGVISGLMPAGIAASNGMFLGILSTAWVRQSGGGVMAVVAIVLGLAPHGIIELTGICVAGAAGMRLSRIAMEENRYLGDIGLPPVIGRLEALGASWPVLLVVTPLLAVAAAIESVGIAADTGCF